MPDTRSPPVSARLAQSENQSHSKSSVSLKVRALQCHHAVCPCLSPRLLLLSFLRSTAFKALTSHCSHAQLFTTPQVCLSCLSGFEHCFFPLPTTPLSISTQPTPTHPSRCSLLITSCMKFPWHSHSKLGQSLYSHGTLLRPLGWHLTRWFVMISFKCLSLLKLSSAVVYQATSKQINRKQSHHFVATWSWFLLSSFLSAPVGLGVSPFPAATILELLEVSDSDW